MEPRGLDEQKALMIIETMIQDHYAEMDELECIHMLVEDIFNTLLDNGIFFVGTDDDY